MVDSILIKINGTDLCDTQDPQWFNLYVPWKYHTAAPEVGVFVYSFATQPENYQPSGHADFTRLQSASIRIEFNAAAVLPCIFSVYAINYNILTVKGGQAALEYTC